MRVADLTAVLIGAALPVAAWGQVAVQPLNSSPLGHLRLNAGWTTNPDTLSSPSGGPSNSPQDPRTQWELAAQMSRRSASRDMDRSSGQDHGRWFLFAAAGGQAVGWTMSPGAPGDTRWASGSASTMINDGQAGVGWRRGIMQASVGYVHREVSGRDFDPYSTRLGKVSDSMVGLSFSLHAH
jgi:hypothetical protein